MTENAIDADKSQTGDTIWQVLADGTLREYSQNNYAFTLSRADTITLLRLLERNRSLILGEEVNLVGTEQISTNADRV